MFSSARGRVLSGKATLAHELAASWVYKTVLLTSFLLVTKNTGWTMDSGDHR